MRGRTPAVVLNSGAMQHTQYTCDWCREKTEPEQMNQLSVKPAWVPRPRPKTEDDSRKNIAAMASDVRRQFDVDICNSCLATFQKWLMTREGQA
jgi:hypothetical protein